MTEHHPNCEDATGAYPGSCTCKTIAMDNLIAQDADLIDSPLVDRLRDFVIAEDIDAAADLIETQAREIERLREALEAYAAHCSICSGGGSIVEEDSITGALLWRDCPGCTPAHAALAGDSHD